jgi:hypothetical protein
MILEGGGGMQEEEHSTLRPATLTRFPLHLMRGSLTPIHRDKEFLCLVMGGARVSFHQSNTLHKVDPTATGEVEGKGRVSPTSNIPLRGRKGGEPPTLAPSLHGMRREASLPLESLPITTSSAPSLDRVARQESLSSPEVPSACEAGGARLESLSSGVEDPPSGETFLQ